MKKKLKVGDTVQVIDETIVGKIIQLNSYRATLEDEFGFELEYPIDKLVIKGDFNLEDLTPTEKHTEYIETLRQERLDYIDLHIDSLKIRYNQLNIPIVEYQINAFHEAIHQALKNKYDGLVVIHGKGTGTLKSILYNELKKYSTFTYSPIEEGSMKNAALKINFYTLKN